MRADESQFPTLLEPAVSPTSSSIHKARVRAALFCKLEPVRVGRFILLEQLGAGAMGEIYAAYDEQLDRRVALKLCRHGSDLTGNADELLLREAKALAQVSHPNVVNIYEVGTHDGRMFIAMELIHGQTLTTWLRDAAQLPRPHRQREILRRFIAAGRGLEAAHAAGVAHRDFKPDNVLVGRDGRVRVVDFGLARVLVDDTTVRSAAEPDADLAHVATCAELEYGTTVRIDPGEPRGDTAITPGRGDDANRPRAAPPKLTAATRLTRTGVVMGTPRFMAPEQMRGAVADHRSDQFSFCVALYHALHGEFPFAGEHPQELLDSIETGIAGTEHGGGLATHLRKALHRGLSIDPEERFASMADLLAALEPTVRPRSIGIAGVTLLAAGAAAMYLWPSPAADPCATAGDGIAAAWSADREAAVHAAFARSDLPYAGDAWQGAKQRIDGYARGWRDQASAACRATHVDHVQSEQQLDRRMLCLERGSRQLAALVTELATGAPDAVQHAVEAAESLPDVRTCSHTESMMFGLEPPPPQVAPQVEAIRAQLARALTQEHLGHNEESLVISRDARTAAERLPYAPVLAEALAQMARAFDARQDASARAEAERLYFQALDIAEAERHDQLAAMIWSQLVMLAQRMDAGTQQAHAWWRRSDAATRRAGNGATEHARLHYLLGEIYYRDSKYAEAADEENRAIAAIANAPDQQLELSRYYDALARSLEPQDRIAEAISLHERALEIARKALGPSHPDVIKRRMNYGNALAKQGQLERARNVLEAALASIPMEYRDSYLDAAIAHAYLSDVSYVEGKLDDAAAHGRDSLRILRRAGAPDHRLAEAYTNLGNVELKREHFQEALAMYEQALALRRPLGRDHYQVGVNEGSIAEALIGLGRYDQALAHVREAERIFDQGSAHNRGCSAWILTIHGEALVGQDHLHEAVSVLEQALPQFAGLPGSTNEARATWALARALYGLGKDAERVRHLAARARELFAARGASEMHHLAAVTSFLQRLSPVPERLVRRSEDGL